MHAAARVGMQPSLADPVDFHQTNIMGLVNICEVACELKMRKLISVSSNTAYHQGDDHGLVETDSPFSVTQANPAAHYGTFKMAREAIGMAYAEFHGVDFLALRVTAVYGFGMRNPLHLKPVVENAVVGKPTRFATGGSMKRNYTHVLDCVVLNVAAGRLCTASEIADIVFRGPRSRWARL
ncbi:SDR family oxidoreductase [Polaromonas sp. P1(28)-13]|nr:SDR family oxidoreductase [Polaromonas sp. P1(28)-13]